MPGLIADRNKEKHKPMTGTKQKLKNSPVGRFSNNPELAVNSTISEGNSKTTAKKKIGCSRKKPHIALYPMYSRFKRRLNTNAASAIKHDPIVAIKILTYPGLIRRESNQQKAPIINKKYIL